MVIVIGADHAGFPLKEALAAQVRQLGHGVLDVGTHGSDPVDYPDYAEAVTEALIQGKADRGVLYLETRAVNQKGEKVMSFRRRVLIPRRPAGG